MSAPDTSVAAIDTDDDDDEVEHPWENWLGRRTRRIVAQNIALSLLILTILVPGALFRMFTLPIAVLAHELSELAVIGNGLELARR